MYNIRPTALKWEKFSFLAHSMGKEYYQLKKHLTCHTFSLYRYRSIYVGKKKSIPQWLSVVVMSLFISVCCSSPRDG